MKNRKKMKAITAILAVSVLVMTAVAVAGADDPPCTCGDICVNESGWWRAGADFNASNTPIQHAINNATAGENICVKDGTYNENVIVNKRLTIRSENGSDSTIVNAASASHVFEITADYVNISGFTATGANRKAGIYLHYVKHCNISDNNASDNYYGIYLYESNKNTLKNNIASENEHGISLGGSDNNLLTNNIANSNNGCGIYLSYSDKNTLKNNIASENNCGIYLWYSGENMLMNNSASKNEYGISLWYSNKNTLTNNTASDNDRGIYLIYSSGNTIYNNYFNNTFNAYDNGKNAWNITKTPGRNIINGPYLGGNYWHDYTGMDLDNDGLGDTKLPYSRGIPNGGDYHPLTSVTAEGGVAVAVHPKVSPITAGGNVYLNIFVISTENFADTFHVYLTNESVPPAYRADMRWFNWTSMYVAIPARGNTTIPLRADIPTGETGTKVFKVVVESTTWEQSEAFDMGIFVIS